MSIRKSYTTALFCSGNFAIKYIGYQNNLLICFTNAFSNLIYEFTRSGTRSHKAVAQW